MSHPFETKNRRNRRDLVALFYNCAHHTRQLKLFTLCQFRILFTYATAHTQRLGPLDFFLLGLVPLNVALRPFNRKQQSSSRHLLRCKFLSSNLYFLIADVKTRQLCPTA